MPQKPEAQSTIDGLRERFEKLNHQKITTEADLKHAEEDLAKLRKEALDAWGTDDLEELQKRLEEMTRENDRRREEYQKHLDKIDADLAEVERNFADS
jgi:phage shock protein A